MSNVEFEENQSSQLLSRKSPENIGLISRAFIKMGIPARLVNVFILGAAITCFLATAFILFGYVL